MQINESEKNRISDLHKKYQNEVNEKRLTLKEGIQAPNEQPIDEFAGIGTFIKKFFGELLTGLKSIFKSTDTKVLSMVSDEMSKVIGGLAKSNTKQVSMTAIKATPGYRRSLSVLVENLSQSKFNLPYEKLTKVQKDTIIKEASKGLNDTIVAELKKTGKTLASNIDNLKGKQLVKMGQKTSQITRTIANIDKIKLNKATSLLKNNAKLVGSGKQGVNLLNKVKGGNVNVVKGGSLFSGTASSLANSNVKVFRLSKDQWKKLAVYGITGAAVLYLIGKLYPNDTVAVIDEDGNDATKTGGGSGGGSSTSTGGSSSGGGKTGGFRDCEGTDFPLAFGCKSSKIAEIQKCLGVADDGKLGKVTMKALEDNKYDTSKGLSQDVYTVIMRNCGKKTETAKPEETKLEPAKLTMANLAPSTTITGSTPTNIQMKPVSDGSKTTKTGKQVYDELKASGLLKKQGLTGRIVVKDKNNAEEPIDVPAAEISALSDYLAKFGYTKGTKEKDKRYGDKFVWMKNRKKEKL